MRSKRISYRSIVLGLWVLTALALVGCDSGSSSGGGGSPGNESLPQEIAAACEQLSLPAHEVAPLADIVIADIAPALAEHLNEEVFSYAAILVDGEDLGGMLIRLPDEDAPSQVFVPAPVYPEAPFVGGEIELALTVGDWRCPARPVQVGALTPVADPKAVLAAQRDEVARLLENTARLFGIQDLAELEQRRAAWEDDVFSEADAVIALFIAQDQLQVLDWVLEHVEEQPEVLALTAALFEHAGEDGFLAGLQDFNAALLPLDPVTTDVPSAAGSGERTVSAVSPLSGRSLAQTPRYLMPQSGQGECGLNPSGYFNIDDAASLDRAMQAQARAQERSESTARRGLDYVGGAVLPAVGLLTGPVGAAVSVAAGAAIHVYSLIEQITIASLPSKIDALEIHEPPPPVLPEDYLDHPDHPARWDDARITASSDGMSLWSATFDTLLQALSVRKWAGSRNDPSTLSRLDNIDRAAGNASAQADTIIREAALDTHGEVGFNFAMSLLNDALSEALGDQSVPACWRISKYTWSDIDVTSMQWTKAESAEGRFTLGMDDVNQQRLSLSETGSDLLIVETQEERFGDQTGRATAPVYIQEAVITPQPRVTYVENLGEEVDVVIAIRPHSIVSPEHPVHATVRPPDSQVEIVQGPEWDEADQVHRMRVKTSPYEAHYPIVIDLSQIKYIKGSQGNTPPERRTAIAQIDFRETLDLSPPVACIGPGESLELTATVSGVESLDAGDIDWTSSSGGSLSPAAPQDFSQTAIFTAPGVGAGSTLVEAHLSDAGSDYVFGRSRIAWGTCDANLYVGGTLFVDGKAVSIGTGVKDELPDNPDWSEAVVNPAPPDGATRWEGRSETLHGFSTDSGEKTVGCSEFSQDGTSCLGEDITTQVAANADGTSTLAADGSGNVSFSFSYTGRKECVATDLPSAQGRVQGVDCGHSSATAGWVLGYYFEIEQAHDKQLAIDLQCSLNGQAAAGAFVGIQVVRVASNDPDQMPLNFLEYNTLQAAMNELSTEELQALVSGETLPKVTEPCTAASGSSSMTHRFDIAEAADLPNADKAGLFISIVTYGLAVAYDDPSVLPEDYNESISEMLGGLGSVVSPFMLEGLQPIEPNPGTYQGGVSVSGTVSLVND